MNTEVGDITAGEILTEIKRELGMRSSVYPKLVNEGKLTHEEAQHRMAVCRRLILEYERKASAEAGQGEMFAEVDEQPRAPVRPQPSADGGDPGPWRRALTNVECPNCKSPLVQWRTVTSKDGAHDDTQLMCLNTVCYHVWWIDGDDG